MTIAPGGAAGRWECPRATWRNEKDRPGRHGPLTTTPEITPERHPGAAPAAAAAASVTSEPGRERVPACRAGSTPGGVDCRVAGRSRLHAAPPAPACIR